METKQNQPYFIQPPPPPPVQVQSDVFSLSNKVSPSTLLIIIILAIIFFISGLLHLLIRILMRPPTRDPDDVENASALQGQLQQLFHLHDAGVDQSFIDALPVFNYKSIIGGFLKDPFDCAVCLCEFEPEDKLRLLPKCSHAFHMDCIDTWLLSHSTCPLCRANLLHDFDPSNNCSSIVLVLESGSESSREIVNERDGNSVLRSNSHLGSLESFSQAEFLHNKSREFAKPENLGEKVVPIKLGKFRNVDGGEGTSTSTCSGSNSVDARRCFSMGSFEYIMDEDSTLLVPIRTLVSKQQNKKPSLPLMPGQRQALSECDCESRREINFHGLDQAKIRGGGAIANANSDSRNKDSFSISKIWLRGKKEKGNSSTGDSSRRAVSFRFPINRNVVVSSGGEDKDKHVGGDRITCSEFGSCRWSNLGSEIGYDQEHQSRASVDSQANSTSFSRRTLLWILGRQNKVIHSSSSNHV